VRSYEATWLAYEEYDFERAVGMWNKSMRISAVLKFLDESIRRAKNSKSLYESQNSMVSNGMTMNRIIPKYTWEIRLEPKQIMSNTTHQVQLARIYTTVVRTICISHLRQIDKSLLRVRWVAFMQVAAFRCKYHYHASQYWWMMSTTWWSRRTHLEWRMSLSPKNNCRTLTIMFHIMVFTPMIS
jgi:hypothetical protein